MITNLSLGVDGRLGNQLFQYAALLGTALKFGYKIKIPHPTTRNWHGQRCLLDEFNIEAGFLTEDDVKSLKFQISEPDYMKPHPMEYCPNNTNLTGYFQSILYFEGYEGEVKKQLTPKQHHLDAAKEYIDKLRKDTGKEIVSVHLRRGDNTDGSNPSLMLNEMYGKDGVFNWNSFYGRYLTHALLRFPTNCRFLVFTGGARFTEDTSSDKKWCRENLPPDFIVPEDDASSIQDFCRIMSCDHNIISHVSSFGWWAAYLNPNPNKKVVAPLHYHPDLGCKFTARRGFYPKDWILE
jgi:hypothetical protein